MCPREMNILIPVIYAWQRPEQLKRNSKVVTKAVLNAMTSKYPQFCYLVGMNTLKANMAKWLLGELSR